MRNYMVSITDRFWSRYREIVHDKMLPYQWAVLNDEIDVKIEKERNDGSSPNEKSHAMANFRIAAKLENGDHYGWVFQDSDVYKWLEAAAYVLRYHPEDLKLRSDADSVVDLIAAAQADDGYLNTFYTIRFPKRRFKRLAESHELYCAGHFFEAAAAYYEVTGNNKVLTVATHFADLIEKTFGPDKEIDGFDGHEEVKIGLMKLYRVTGDRRYLDLTKYFLDVRGTKPDFFTEQLKNDPGEDPIKGVSEAPLSYFQADIRPVDQTVARGHAVRQVYLLTAMADYAAESKDPDMLAACCRLWRDITDRQMYVTGGIGSTVHGEAFTFDHNLPNDTMYCETCAAVGMIFFARRMLENELNGEYADIMERVLYNSAISGMALDGQHFFYVNPLEVIPEACKKDPGKPHVMTVRPAWLGCACCPPNLARLIASLDDYIYTVRDDTVAINLFISSEASFDLADNKKMSISMDSLYPKKGEIHIKVNGDGRLAIRVPSYAKNVSLEHDHDPLEMHQKSGYIYVTGPFTDEEITLQFSVEPIIWKSHPYVRADIGRLAVSRGPFVYCAESVDNGDHLECLMIRPDTAIRYELEDGPLGHIGVLYASGFRYQVPEDTPLYRPANEPDSKQNYAPVEIKLIPYYAWANRGENEMSVWLTELIQ